MKTYTAYFYTDAEYASTEIEASDAQEALEKAKAINESNTEPLDFEHYSEGHPVNHIEITDEDGSELMEWRDPDLLLREAAPELFRACRLLVDAYAKGRDGEHIDWSDIDIAHDAAQRALSMAEVEPRPTL